MTRAHRLAFWTAMAGLATVPSHASAQPRAQVDYMLECQGCHLPDGSGSAGSVPSLVDSIGRFVRIPEGRGFLVRVPGSAQSPLDDARLAAVLNWMIREFGPAEIAADFEPYASEEVAAYRRDPLVDVALTRQHLLDRIMALGPVR